MNIYPRQDLLNEKIFDFCIGALIFASTLFFASNAILIFVLFFLLAKGKSTLWKSQFLFPLFFVLFAYLNIIIHIADFDLSKHASSFAVIFVFFTALLALKIADRSLKLFILLTCLEIFVGIYEFAIGQVAISPSQVELANQEMSYESMYLYDIRVYGLSSNSSVLAEKIFLSILLLFNFRNSFRHFYFISTVLAVGLFISFNRTTIFTVTLFVCFIYFSGRASIRKRLLGTVILFAAGSVVSVYWEDLLLQFARGSLGELSYSEMSRLYFWEKSIEHLASNPVFGSGSLTYRIFSPEVGTFQHAHNSLIMIFSTHGVFIPFFLFAYILVRLKYCDWRVIISILVYSITQYIVFWNLSVPDLILFWFLGVEIYKRRISVEKPILQGLNSHVIRV